MGSIRARKDSGLLFFDFRVGGERCREQTTLPDTPENRRRMAKVLAKIDSEIETGTFDYGRYFPNSKRITAGDRGVFSVGVSGSTASLVPTVVAMPTMTGPIAPPAPLTPVLKDFAETWYAEQSVSWRRTYRTTVRSILDQHIIPRFGHRPVAELRRKDLLEFRADLARQRGRAAGSTLSPQRINAVMLVAQQVLNEAADRYEFSTPVYRITPLKVKKSDVQPFSLDETMRIIEAVRADFRPYYTVRFLTGMRTGEIDGLKWKYVDFERRLILIRESFTHGEQEEDVKTATSVRDIQMSQPVFEALKVQEAATGKLSEYVFCNRDGGHLDTNNVTKRVWYPLLRHLGLAIRRPYQTRHTAATLWLASGENPEWVAKQLGHANTQMLFQVYSRFVPNLTRQDGSAFERLFVGRATPTTTAHEQTRGGNHSHGAESGGRYAEH